jgi:hypothetical protein
MNKKIISILLQLPFILLVVASFLGSIYALVKKIGGISPGVPFILGFVIILYFYGRYLENKFKGGYQY